MINIIKQSVKMCNINQDFDVFLNTRHNYLDTHIIYMLYPKDQEGKFAYSYGEMMAIRKLHDALVIDNPKWVITPYQSSLSIAIRIKDIIQDMSEKEYEVWERLY